jgi:REP element-mobilizing transposase RayT
MKLDNNAHSVFLLNYHLVLVVKYRHKVFDDNISKTTISKFINAYKSASSRLIKKEYPEIKKKLWE